MIKTKTVSSNKTTSSTKVVTGRVRLTYVHVFKPAAMNEAQEPKYSACVLIPKSDKDTIQKIRAAIEAAKEAGTPRWGNKNLTDLKLPLRDGDKERPGNPDYVDHFFLNANSKQPPGIVDKYLNDVIDTTEVYSGCYARVSLTFYAFNTAGNRGIACGLNNIQKIADGDYLGGRTRAKDDFNEYGEEDNIWN